MKLTVMENERIKEYVIDMITISDNKDNITTFKNDKKYKKFSIYAIICIEN